MITIEIFTVDETLWVFVYMIIQQITNFIPNQTIDLYFLFIKA